MSSQVSKVQKVSGMPLVQGRLALTVKLFVENIGRLGMGLTAGAVAIC